MSTWDFSQDLDFGVDFYFGDDPVPQVADKTTVYERRKELNRTAQQRTRQKKKERSSNIEAQLAETTGQLHDLRLRQSQLEAQNRLLELVIPNNQAGLPASVPQQSLQAEVGEVVLEILERAGLNRTQQGAALMLTVHGYETEVKIEDIGRMSYAYVRKQARCLLDVDGNTELSHPSMTEMHQRGLEATAVLMCFSMCSPSNNGITHSLNMKDGTLFQEPPSADVLAKLLVAMDFSMSQQEDMLHLRRLFYGKLGQLARARAAVMDRLAAEVQHISDLPFNKAVTHDLADTTDWADQLCANGAEESRAHLFCAVALYGGITSSRQQAVLMVHYYPRAGGCKVLLDVLAQQNQEPSPERLAGGFGLDDLQHTANWQAVVFYVESLDASGVHGHCPLRPRY
ncbi:TPA: hypothetical protein ACH3X1_015893 [Trebouxia sp. C0004]